MNWEQDYEIFQIMERVLDNSIDPSQYTRHNNWRVRYAAAVAIGEKKNPEYIDILLELLKNEDKLDLYSQPKVKEFIGGYDDTRMAEMLVSIKEVFSEEYSDDIKEIWKCRGRVRHAAIFALYEIGVPNEEIERYLCESIVRPNEDFAVCAATARTLGKIGSEKAIPYIERAMQKDEWCLRCEGKKAILNISQKIPQ